MRTCNKPHTNYVLEGFPNAIRKSMTQTHPSIWTLIDGLRNEEVLAQAKLLQLGRDGNPTKRTKVTLNLQRLIEGYNPAEKLKLL